MPGNKKLNENTYEQVKNYLMAGLTLKDALALVDIAYTTWNGYERKDPSLRRKRKQWQGMLKAQAKLNIAKYVYGDKRSGIEPDPAWSRYLLDEIEKQETKAIQNNLSKARIERLKAETERLKFETKQLSENDSLTKIVFTDDLKPDAEVDNDGAEE
ncbi:hypothetical protein [Lactobacillus sp. 3B(2020)]|uniref:hypothetical protein n=1 Tax=Lactobacillus sp. 3B(2020) TaxID=2695882 RepID=UPI0015DF3B9A|nr:hypothetical protein [Lactobacillus sp. 3B(2020)]QLL69588.1 hypothetical protein GTO83_03050 [Lactobacillus sp. 3B(2020)]